MSDRESVLLSLSLLLHLFKTNILCYSFFIIIIIIKKDVLLLLLLFLLYLGTVSYKVVFRH